MSEENKEEERSEDFEATLKMKYPIEEVEEEDEDAPSKSIFPEKDQEEGLQDEKTETAE